MSANDCDGRIRDISILPSREGREPEPLTEAEQSTLRSELEELLWTACIARPGALCDESAPSQTFGTIGEAIVNPGDIDEVVAVNNDRAICMDPYSHMPGFEAPDRNLNMEADRVNLIKKIKRSTSRKRILRSII